ncbi:MAG: ParA family protein [Actinobacteria bacterium]|nr:ParA family protein [Actinomycetota bacterium]MCB8997018.1 ParA family protein [Actinomycetota bacterium]MCB9413991.1 ParA family protein [Actinomycetota bacterium]MCB9424500.1 ParA family protein [Actinomycetota bacterium]
MIVTVANQKGGVGKTTTVVNLAAALAELGKTVLVVDLDPQGNATTGLGVSSRTDNAGVYDVLIEDVPMAQTVVGVPETEKVQLVPASLDLAGAEIELVSMVAREYRLRKALAAYLEEHPTDVVLIDCPPSLGLLTLNALVAAEELLIPIQCEYYALEGLGQLIRTVDMVREHLNPTLRISSILLTMTDSRTNLSEQVADEVRAFFGDLVLDTAIPRSVRLSEAPGHGRSGVAYDEGSRGALAYRAAAEEFTQRTVDLRDPTAETVTA